MARIAGVNIPKEKRFVIALTYIYGIGNTTAQKICQKLKIDLKLRTHQIPEEKIIQVRSLIEKEFLLILKDWPILAAIAVSDT